MSQELPMPFRTRQATLTWWGSPSASTVTFWVREYSLFGSPPGGTTLVRKRLQIVSIYFVYVTSLPLVSLWRWRERLQDIRKVASVICISLDHLLVYRHIIPWSEHAGLERWILHQIRVGAVVAWRGIPHTGAQVHSSQDLRCFDHN
jgi:hypothetical protein